LYQRKVVEKLEAHVMFNTLTLILKNKMLQNCHITYTSPNMWIQHSTQLSSEHTQGS